MVAVTAGAARIARPTFYLWMSAAFILIAFGGFIPTYWAKLATNSFPAAPIVHIHGTLFFGWTLFYLFQTSQVAAGRTPDHRTWGVAGVSLATAMCISIVLMTIHSMKMADAAGQGDAARRFAVVSLTGVIMVAGLFAAAIANVKRPEVLKRLMILMMLPLMHAATARVFLTLFAPPGAATAGPPPVFVAIPPGLFVIVVLGGAALIHDWRTRGRPHPVYLVGLPLLIVQVLCMIPIAATPQWMAIARAVEGLTG
jgi:hypothetical protein